MVADSRAGRADHPLMVYPALLVAQAQEALLAVTGTEDERERAAALGGAAEAIAGAAEMVTDVAVKARTFAARRGRE